MSRYVVHFTGYVYIDAPNVAQAAKQAKLYKMLGEAQHAHRPKNNKKAIICTRGKPTVKMGLPMKVEQSGDGG